MQKTTLTAAIAAALAVPMAAHAVDVTLSGHVNRALFITDSDSASSTSGKFRDNASSGTRIRVTGTGEMMEGQSAGVLLEYGAGSALSLRYADVWFGGGFGKVSIGQGDQGGEGSVYKGGASVLGTGHGQDTADVTVRPDPVATAAKGEAVTRNYYTSLDGGGGRNERLRYDTPAVGPFSAAVSVGNGDQVSAGVSLSQEFGGSTFSAGVGTIQHGGSNKSAISASAGIALVSGLKVSGAWGTGKDFDAMMTPAIAAIPASAAIPKRYMHIDTRMRFEFTNDEDNSKDHFFGTGPGGMTPPTKEGYTRSQDEDGSDLPGMTFDGDLTGLEAALKYAMNEVPEGTAPTTAQQDAIDEAQMNLDTFRSELGGFNDYMCEVDAKMVGKAKNANCAERLYMDAVAEGATQEAVEAVDAKPNMVDPSFFQVAVSYGFGNTSVGASWYQSSDTVNDGSKTTAAGLGVDHNMPKIATNVYAAVQNYNVEDGAYESDDTVVMIGARVKF